MTMTTCEIESVLEKMGVGCVRSVGVSQLVWRVSLHRYVCGEAITAHMEALDKHQTVKVIEAAERTEIDKAAAYCNFPWPELTPTANRKTKR